ncbi:hypothetical protein [Kordiimonas aestuarii]|uniref:hypothetical protein n=1 Tax=Kordiimonas aestuarii TaxID=1005925 RepID=UPI0021D3025D|nr:hypothetical protein [Kordiimonas aestuarii]
MKQSNFSGILRAVTLAGVIAALPCTGVSADDALEARLKALEGEVRALRVQVADLSAELRTLKATPSTAIITEQSNCVERINALDTKRAKLKDMGLSDRHPDVINMSVRLDELKASCKDK